MKKVCLFNSHLREQFGDYHLDSLDPALYFSDAAYGDWRDFLAGGLQRFRKLQTVGTAEGLDRLYRYRDSAYMRFLEDFVNRYHDYDLLVLSTFNCIHPEVLFHELKKPIKVLGFIDDPISTYIRGIPYLWAFDGAFYISPSYLNSGFPEALDRWGCSKHFWWPLCPYNVRLPENIDDEFFSNRDIDVTYVGKSYTHKLPRIIKLKQHFRKRFHIYGRWPLWGYSGLLRGLSGQPVLWQRVRRLSHEERSKIYFRTKIGFNLHWSETPAETGNMRMYEVPAHGAMLLCDKAAVNAHEKIFVADSEAVYYDSIDDAIEKAEYYLAHDKERLEIAWSGFERVRRDYDFDKNLLAFLNWAMSLRREKLAPMDQVHDKAMPREALFPQGKR